ncbi:response regulator transcription factor [Pseudoflavitalea sp. G-6-1-2]|uniref:LytR/AlgR family response regulator transcription factor n=1 Tax=Pseudoflavitalea sp. G-6-1-2 TaxID=2728841 RepID=UPI00146DF2DE|nr:LytTR family DNA-binding domain-containing protein [Pseudoflavitalea sp. G-6-1-2]NML23979.1 response regulator transcription factor [Pseudoflavitalea sp. G-6-1-2]
MIDAIIVDDESRNISILKKMLAGYCPEVRVIGEAGNAAETISLLQTLKPQLLFLDIQMPGQNAFNLLDEIMPVNFDIIFVTAFDSYALKAFKYNAIDYLLKPVSIDDLQEAVKKVLQRTAGADLNQKLEGLLQELSAQQQQKKITLHTQEGMYFFNYADIVLCIAEGSYTRFELSSGKNMLVSGTLKKFEALLPEHLFLRIHSSYIVNANHIKKYHNGKGGYVELTNGKTAEVSVRKKAEFLSHFRQ